MKTSKLFSTIQETGWYHSFLEPVVNEIGSNGSLLDIGTGAGKLIQLILSEKDIDCTGIDTNPDMLQEAYKTIDNPSIKLQKVEPNTQLPFEDNSFHYITICNVLFLLEKKQIDFMLNEARRLLKREGKIIVLTPTGKGNLTSLTTSFFSLKNLSIYIWYYATKNRAGPWTDKLYLEQYSIENDLKHKRKITLNGFAQVEILQ